MGALARRSIAIAGVFAVCACNALTGAEGLGVDPALEEGELIPPRERHRTEQVDDGGSSSSSSSGALPDPTGGTDGGDAGAGAGDAGLDAPAGGPVFFDAFERADSPTIGNGWTEKTDRFAIAAGAVKQSGLGSYKNLIVRRPASEDALDVEISVDVTHDKIDGDPCLYARMQPGSNTAGSLVSYTFYVYFDFAFLDRDDGDTAFAELASQAISPPLPTGSKYSLTLRVTGTSPVKVEGIVKNASGVVVASLSAMDGSAKRIAVPGGVGFGSGDADGALFDNFRRAVP